MTTNEQQVSVSREIRASPEEIFDVLADPRQHPAIDGSGSVRGVVSGPDRLEMGSKFGMSMKIGLPYRIKSTVVEFDENRRIAWAHFGKHRWRYELEPFDDGARTRVTETFDYSTARSPWLIEKLGYPKKHPANMDATLERLAAHVENSD
ncbi:MAG: SRPBCC family protein [Acidimicrobiia bacterium]|nr:SRPBCC family protein [Acidimicrobiia bacterium]